MRNSRIRDLQEEQCRLNVDFERQLQQHAQADSRQLADMMRTKLPLELRELLYKYLYLEDAPIPVGSYHFTTYVPEPLRSEETNMTHDEPFILIPEGATRQDHSIERDENIVYPDSRLLDPATYLTFYDNLHDGEKKLVQSIFDALHDFSSHVRPAIASQLHVEFCMMTAYKEPVDEDGHNRDNRHHLNLLEALRVPVYMLKHDLGVDITIIHYDEHVSVFPRNVTAIFQLSEDKWSKEKQAYKAADISYSPSQYYVDIRGSTKPFALDDSIKILYSRWGLSSAFNKECKFSIRESEVWPIRQDLLRSGPMEE
ncbi:uncharacterized protein N0V89_005886 [Didymosphaeria variabile]|uniref:Uncharacterized protein n=1 Tax=Didymosphaeria variabile TaxID=1932322 RepID=A0A9W8XNR2_9PLEO|nr:uncharacterized protein N0V89_005886 [Didymosphaeria variabile]KAJ4354153.1 hypothetical protein N0V89_005886 [Didymosphaeria variabile]